MSDFRPPPRKKTPLDNVKLKMYAPSPGNPSKKASLTFGIYEGNPRLTVYAGDADNTNMSAKLDPRVFYAFLELLKVAMTAEPGYKDKIVNKNFTFPGGQRSQAPMVVSELHIGKSADGQIWVSVTSDSPLKIQFFFECPEFHSLVHGDGTPFTAGETSLIFAKADINILERMVSDLLVDTWPEIEQAAIKRNEAAAAKRATYNTGGNRSTGNYNQGQGNTRPAAAAPLQTEDFPF